MDMNTILYQSFMSNCDREIEPFQLWLKNRCIWAELHQRTLFYAFLVLLMLIELMLGFAGGFTFAVWLGLIYTIVAATAGKLAASKNRNLWVWGLALGWLLFSIVILIRLRPICSSCFKPISAAKGQTESCSVCGSRLVSRYLIS